MKQSLFLRRLGSARSLQVLTALALTLYLSAIPMQIVQAATLVVDMDDDGLRTACTPSPNDCTLRGAILHAESTPEMDVINVPEGRYVLSEGPLTVRSSLFLIGEGQGKTFIDGDNTSQVLIVSEIGGPTVNIHDITIENGKGGSGVPGGAIFVEEGAYLALYDSTVRNSGSNGPGGGIANNGTLQLIRSTVSGNKAPMEGPPMTGGVQHSAGGIWNSDGALLKIDRSTISDNEASRGGGIRNAGGHMEITNSTISGNKAFARGGGIMNFGTAFIAFSTITDNEANVFLLSCVVDAAEEEFLACGGGIYNTGRISIGNTILAGNTDHRHRLDIGFSPDCFSPEMFSLTSFRGNLMGILTSNCSMRDTIWGDSRFDMVGTPDVPLDPKLTLLSDVHGGPTATHALMPDSTAIDNGTGVTSATFFDCPSQDQRGVTRPQGAACDMGAFELEAEIEALDDFSLVDGLIGENWLGNTSRYRISDNQLLVRYDGSNTDIYWDEEFGSDQEAFVTFVDVDEDATEHNLLLKAQSRHTWGEGVIEVLYDARNHVVQVWTWEWPQGWMMYGDQIPVTFVDGDTFSARARADGTVEVYRNGALLGLRDITTWSHYARGGYIGLWFIGARDTILDDFGGGSLP